MARKTKYNRYYSKGKYEAVSSGLGISLVFIGVAILASIMVTFNIQDPFLSLETWGHWMFIPGFFMILGSFGQFNNNRNYQKAVKNALLDRNNIVGKFKLEDLALEVGIRPKDILKVLIDLRNKGSISYRFDPSSGEIYLGEKISYSQSNGFVPPPKTINGPLPKGKEFCQYCGHIIDTGAVFCEHCGSEL